MTTEVDVFIIGGGINGAAVARDAAGRGLRVFLAEKDDFAQATSSASSKLIHGGLRYLEHYEFRLVRESLREREVMLRIAPHLTRVLRFLLPISRVQPRPTWAYRAGLFLYQALAGGARIERVGRITLPGADTSQHSPLHELRTDALRAVLHYPDVQVDDARLVLATLLDAKARGATIRNRAEVTDIHRSETGFAVRVRERGCAQEVRARALVNATGPWAERLAGLRVKSTRFLPRLKLVRGSHLVIREPAGAPRCAYTLPLTDGRVVFVIPWLDGLRIIGTTDVVHEESADRVACSTDEQAYLLAAYNTFFRTRIAPQDILARWSGVRPLLDDGATSASELTRDYRLSADSSGAGIAVDIYGGKLTTHRRLAEAVLEALRRCWPALARPWTASAPLVGGELGLEDLDELWRQGPAVLPVPVRRRWVHTYGSVAQGLFERVARDAGAAGEIAPGVVAAELEHAVECEMAVTPADFLERRTKLGLFLDAPAKARVERWFAERARYAHAR